MSSYQYTELKIDKIFKTLIPPLSAEEYRQLEENLLNDGCRDPICVWNGIIIDGHNRYELCLRHEISFQTRQVNLESRHEVIAWICANQIGRRNISEETRRYLIGKRYESEKIIGSRNHAGKNQYTKGKELRPKMLAEPNARFTEHKTARRLGEEYRLSHATIAKYGAYSRAVDILAQNSEALVPQILSGQTKISQNNMIALSKLPAQEIERLSNNLLQNNLNFIGFAVARKKLDRNARHRNKKNPASEITVKDMPAFDPDAEISSLSLTIPSWISSIERTQSLANFELVSERAKDKLAIILNNLKNASDHLLGKIRR